jgi:hypothetical protein
LNLLSEGSGNAALGQAWAAAQPREKAAVKNDFLPDLEISGERGSCKIPLKQEVLYGCHEVANDL